MLNVKQYCSVFKWKKGNKFKWPDTWQVMCCGFPIDASGNMLYYFIDYNNSNEMYPLGIRSYIFTEEEVNKYLQYDCEAAI